MRGNRILWGIVGTVTFAFWCAEMAEGTKYAGEYLTLGVGGRALGLGGAYVSMADDVTASYWNPAGLALLDRREMSFMHAENFAGIVQYDFLAYGQAWGDSTRPSGVGIGLVRLGVDEIPVTSTLELLDYGLDGEPNTGDEGEGNGRLDVNERIVYDEDKISWTSDNEIAVYLSYGRGMSSSLYLGGSVKILGKFLYENSAVGIGADVGALYRPRSWLTVGAVLQDMTTSPLVWNTGTRETITPTLRAGLSSRHLVERFEGDLTLAAGTDVRFEEQSLGSTLSSGGVSLDLHVGAEYRYRDMVGVRLGADRGRLTAGAGFSVRMFLADYAFLAHEDLGNSHRVSLGVQF
ncbi:hypothetical protein AMJ39_02595 [candidate division TA06 bacterium DG_24]|uniref:PorV/PorQ family protein n=3 Tax=Bacteria division TA06 TaxID=1156500 RepID=A0A0S8JLL8_UNCT6|nr:MAG: hypothetical protein AMJ39_02595 [candidate division TA06 bacterium DG_24]KPK71344.1 MAG: hypothetical protein AMJ82_01085 [candidate division TA06 bacterium SM23_40]KPL10625.1 MAG: hypothetical protein AMJ71_02550 [candidate division TA06 bacterium SM1_40]